ncbi:MAG: LysM peptidoglycan-binding domain-containing protein [Anaerolineales bacterium]|nr:LysM peptidoglycan-binding domain-containing protein [Anaerolineales bacterium]
MVRRLATFVFLILILGLVAGCDQLQPPAATRAALPPTTTRISPPQATAVSNSDRPETTTEITAAPTITPTATLTRTAVTYVIQPGDTLVTIGNRFDVSVQELAETNDITNPNSITAGQVLVIPEQVVPTAVLPTNTLPPPTPTPIIETTDEADSDGGTPAPPDELAPTGRLEITHPVSMVVAQSGVITVEIIADPELAQIGEHEPHVTGIVRIDASYDDGERAFYEQTVELFPLMSAELNAPAFEVFPSGGNNVRLPRVISTTLPAVWTWDIIATTPGEDHIFTVNLYKEPDSETGIPILTQSISRSIQVVPKSLWNQLVDSLANNVLLLLGTGGPLGLLLAFLTYRATKENERLKKSISESEKETDNAAE